MHDAPGIPRIASLLADPARAKIVWTLIDGTTRPAGALGDPLLDLYVARGWVQRERRSRVVSISAKGNDAFARLFS